MEVNMGTIIAFLGSWGSGLGVLVIKSVDGLVMEVPCENAPTVRALDGAFGDVIGNGHTVNQSAIRGKRIYWSYDSVGLILDGFTPVDEAPCEMSDAFAREFATQYDVYVVVRPDGVVAELNDFGKPMRWTYKRKGDATKAANRIGGAVVAPADREGG